MKKKILKWLGIAFVGAVVAHETNALAEIRKELLKLRNL